MSDDGPRLIRPIPRRPFDLNHKSLTPPEDDSSPPSPNPEIDLSRLHNGQATSSESGSIPRAQSVLNLTASTLFGIYSPMSYGKDRCYNDREETETPWGTGAQTPIKGASVDDTTFELMKDRSSPMRRRSSNRNRSNTPSPSTAVTALFTISRAALLFLIGMGYGLMVTRLQNEHRFSSFQVESMIKPGYDWQYLTVWGLFGVALGGLLPWFDGVWEDTFGKEEEAGTSPEDTSPVKDWALVVRSIGAFVGIVFAIRKLPWASTMQVSLTLALVNPFLWYLIDRSKPGFLLSAAVGLAGSAMLMGINPDIMPTPSSLTYRNESERAYSDPITLGGLASQETIETGIWMLSVLFCSCVCFGNIGRRLALNKSATARGRWAGIR
ncbi:insulin-induced protein [Colletotrichum graminicola]|uniref:Insulin-induced protein n=1 Tax=Colletotrichum graminicola (strain M1.001 / M2 / FGSC 10212) TaxID=645133 RepID=E3QR22_COLGM|nr:insulin-induced protein [Colletotrichum graminicola M1.001]EFQ33310.1 insulin-induced protein [Colletotrichum graminicola M1.001]WDK15696.1 insulin-induced protein [Colletotrichum graminicola]